MNKEVEGNGRNYNEATGVDFGRARGRERRDEKAGRPCEKRTAHIAAGC